MPRDFRRDTMSREMSREIVKNHPKMVVATQCRKKCLDRTHHSSRLSSLAE